MDPIRQNVIGTAQRELGTSEEPDNSNRTPYGKWYGMNGVSWCAIFVSWVFNKAGVPLGKIDSLNGYHYCPSALNFFKKMGCVTDDPKPGDLVFFDWQGDKLSDHTGIFVGWVDKGKTEFITIEGNTSLKNQSDGGQVMERHRFTSRVIAFVKPLVYKD